MRSNEIQPKLATWADRLAKAAQQTKDRYLIDRKDLEELKDLLDALNDREEYGVI